MLKDFTSCEAAKQMGPDSLPIIILLSFINDEIIDIFSFDVLIMFLIPSNFFLILSKINLFSLEVLTKIVGYFLLNSDIK